MKQKNVLKLVTVAAFVVVLLIMAFVGLYVTDNTYNNRETKKVALSMQDIKTGLDISGGVSAIYRPDLEKDATPEEMSKAKTIMRKRLDDKSLFDATVNVDLNNNWLEIEIPNETDPEKAISGLRTNS